ncbi:MAG: hypothetical protein ACJ72W_02150 [Actinoallomurus sp.]
MKRVALWVTNLGKGTLLRIPFQPGGRAGTAVIPPCGLPAREPRANPPHHPDKPGRAVDVAGHGSDELRRPGTAKSQ